MNPTESSEDAKKLTNHSVEHLTSGSDGETLISPASSSSTNEENIDIVSLKQISAGISYSEVIAQSMFTSAVDDMDPVKRVFDPKNVSYTEMISRAIFSSTNNVSTLQDIYKFLIVKYPELKTRGKSWKNSVRHTLSLNECFVKLPRANNGKCCYWSIHPFYVQRFKKGDFQKQKRIGVEKHRRMKRHPTPYDLGVPYHLGESYNNVPIYHPVYSAPWQPRPFDAEHPSHVFTMQRPTDDVKFCTFSENQISQQPPSFLPIFTDPKHVNPQVYFGQVPPAYPAHLHCNDQPISPDVSIKFEKTDTDRESEKDRLLFLDFQQVNVHRPYMNSYRFGVPSDQITSPSYKHPVYFTELQKQYQTRFNQSRL